MLPIDAQAKRFDVADITHGGNVHNAQFIVKSKRTVQPCILHMMEHDDRPDSAKRLEKARISRGFTSAADAARYFGWSYDTYIQHENGTRGIVRAAQRYAKAFRVTPGWLLTGEGAGPGELPVNGVTSARMVRVKGFVQAGHWAETWEWPDDDQYTVPVPFDEGLSPFSLYGAETRGPSMDKRYPQGTVLIFTDAIETHEDVEIGARYIVERERPDGMREATVKTLWRDDAGEMWLLPESNDPRFQEPIPVNGDDDDTIRIVGRVRYAVSRE